MCFAFLRIGSDEDDEGEDETYSYEDPSDTAVSHDFGTYSHDDMAREYTEEGGFNQPEPLVSGLLVAARKLRLR